MGSPSGPPSGWDADDTVDVRAEALDVVSDALAWRLAAARWDAIGQTLAAMATALAADDQDALVAATADLELASPLRITRIGATPVVPPPVPVRDLLNRLVHQLGGTVETGREETWSAEADDGDATRS